MKLKKIKGYQIAIIIFVVVLIAALLGSGIYCSVNDETPQELIHDIVTPDKEQLIGKWQGVKAIAGYEFKDDGTYDSYILGFSTTKLYEINGNKLTLKSSSDNRRVIYEYKVRGEKLYLTLVESEGKEHKDEETQVYQRVKSFNFKTATEAIQDLADELKESTTAE